MGVPCLAPALWVDGLSGLVWASNPSISRQSLFAVNGIEVALSYNGGPLRSIFQNWRFISPEAQPAATFTSHVVCGLKESLRLPVVFLDLEFGEDAIPLLIVSTLAAGSAPAPLVGRKRRQRSQ
jgi:hypothetical protein